MDTNIYHSSEYLKQINVTNYSVIAKDYHGDSGRFGFVLSNNLQSIIMNVLIYLIKNIYVRNKSLQQAIKPLRSAL